MNSGQPALLYLVPSTLGTRAAETLVPSHTFWWAIQQSSQSYCCVGFVQELSSCLERGGGSSVSSGTPRCSQLPGRPVYIADTMTLVAGFKWALVQLDMHLMVFGEIVPSISMIHGQEISLLLEYTTHTHTYEGWLICYQPAAVGHTARQSPQRDANLSKIYRQICINNTYYIKVVFIEPIRKKYFQLCVYLFSKNVSLDWLCGLSSISRLSFKKNPFVKIYRVVALRLYRKNIYNFLNNIFILFLNEEVHMLQDKGLKQKRDSDREFYSHDEIKEKKQRPCDVTLVQSVTTSTAAELQDNIVFVSCHTSQRFDLISLRSFGPGKYATWPLAPLTTCHPLLTTLLQQILFFYSRGKLVYTPTISSTGSAVCSCFR